MHGCNGEMGRLSPGRSPLHFTQRYAGMSAAGPCERCAYTASIRLWANLQPRKSYQTGIIRPVTRCCSTKTLRITTSKCMSRRSQQPEITASISPMISPYSRPTCFTISPGLSCFAIFSYLEKSFPPLCSVVSPHNSADGKAIIILIQNLA